MNLAQLKIENLRSRSGEKWSRYPDDVLPAWVADMDFEIAPAIREAVEGRLSLSDCGYPMAAAQTGLPEIFCQRVAERFNWHISPDQVDLYNDVVQAIYFGLLTLADKNDGVIIQTPIYPPFMGSTVATERRMILSPLVFDERGFEIDFDRLEQQIDDDTKILLLCNPHNPSGRCFTRAELEALAALALRFDLSIISDEIHADLVYAPHQHIPIASLSSEIAARTMTLMSASKAFNIAGICMAFAVYGSDDLRRRVDALPRHLRGGVSALSIAAVGAAFSAGQSWLDEVMVVLQSNRDFLADFAKSHWPRVRHVAPQATYLSWFDFSAYALPPNPYRYFLEHGRVALGDGTRFGDPGRTAARINFATSPAILQQIVERVDSALTSAE